MSEVGWDELGANPVEGGVRFTVLAPEAQAVELLLYRSARAASGRTALHRLAGGFWSAVVAGARIGDLYGYSVTGPRDGKLGDKLDPEQILLDPWAIEIGRLPQWELGVDPAFVAPALARVADRRFDFQGVKKPVITPERRVIYEAHPSGLTKLHPELPESLRGTYLGLCHPVMLEHYRRLGITSLELLPVHAHFDDRHLAERGLANFWGYSTLSWFAPHPYATRPERALDEFRTMVRELHRAGLEVILDVVYNHSCEGGSDGPDLGLRGFGTWYRRTPDGAFEDLTGCGNSLDFGRPQVRKFVLQSLRHWAEACQVDGFRFDLASVHGRGPHGFDPLAPFFGEMASDPVLAKTLRIAEPWDATTAGYGLGRFPEPWLEWNDRFRDDARKFWKGEGSAREFGLRLAGSPDVFVDRPYGASVNFVACHDGFTLRDLVTFKHKHNQANGEANRDGSDWDHSDNLGVEGETLDPAILELRERRIRNLLASALFAQGTPMLLAGDEQGRTQAGNNNAYCQNNPISWVAWSAEGPSSSWVAQILALRSEFPPPGSWEWMGEPQNDAVGVLLRAGAAARILFANRAAHPHTFELPPGAWRLRFDSGSESGGEDQIWAPGAVEVQPNSFLVLDQSGG